MSPLKKSLAFMTLTGLTLTSHFALAAILNCPSTIRTNQSLQQKIDGWDGFLDDGNKVYSFNRVTFYSGHPKFNASLAPDNEGTKGDKLIWSFGKDKIWLACGYSNTDIKLIRELPDIIKTCTVTYRSNFSEITVISCI